MSGGVYTGRPFSFNLKCIVFTACVAGGYWFLPPRRWWALAALLWLPYVSMVVRPLVLVLQRDGPDNCAVWTLHLPALQARIVPAEVHAHGPGPNRPDVEAGPRRGVDAAARGRHVCRTRRCTRRCTRCLDDLTTLNPQKDNIIQGMTVRDYVVNVVNYVVVTIVVPLQEEV